MRRGAAARSTARAPAPRIAVLLAGLALAAAAVAAPCELARLVEMPVTMSGSGALVAAKINGREARLLVHSGSAWSMLTAAAAEDLNLTLRPAPHGITVSSRGVRLAVKLTTVDQLVLGNVSLGHTDFFVGISEPGNGAVGTLGLNVLRLGDVEYDYANGMVRLLRATDCRNDVLAYWAKSQPYSVIDIDAPTPLQPFTRGAAFVNGTKVRVVFDSGAHASILSRRVAEQVGVHPGGPDVVEGSVWGAVGRPAVRTWIGPFASFRIGDEEVKNTRLRFGEVALADADLQLGADFFLSHRIYVANSQHKLYFTYNGGPVFNLSTAAPAAAGAAAAAVAEAGGAADSPEPADAEAFARRGAAAAARRDYQHAVADLTRACELAPTEPAYYFQRGVAHRNMGQLPPALADFDQALKLKPDDVRVRVARADARLAGGDRPGALEDLGAADTLAPKSADVRASMGQLYLRLDRLPQAVAQFDLWIGSHPQDSGLFRQLNSRCWARALLGQELEQALADCNAALKLNPAGAEVLDSRGLVHLRRGEFERAIADYDAALTLQPQMAWSLYGRGLAKLHRGMADQGQADIAAAKALRPQVEDDARRYGVAP